MEIDNKNTKKTMGGVAFGAFLISFSAVFVKIAKIGPTASAFYRVLIGGIFILCWLLIRHKKVKIPAKDVFISFLCAIIFAVDLTFWHKSIEGVGPGLATVLANFQVFFLAFLGLIFFKEKITLKFFISIFLAIIGILLLVGPNWQTVSSDWRWGVIFGLLTAIAYSAYLLSLRKLQTNQNFLRLLWNMAMISIFSAIILAGEMLTFMNEDFAITDLKTLACLLAYGIFCQAIGWIILSKNLPLVDVSIAGLIILLQPFLSFCWDILFFSRPTSLIDIIGGTLALFAIYLGSTIKKSMN